ADLLGLIQQQAGEPRTSALHGNYMGNTHTFYAIRVPQLRAIAKAWMSQHRDLGPEQLDSLVTSLVEAPSSTEKILAGVLFDYARKEQRAINPKRCDEWLNHVEGWAETDALRTNKYTITQLPPDWKQWEKQLPRFAVSKQIQKRRASLVFLCAPLRKF